MKTYTDKEIIDFIYDDFEIPNAVVLKEEIIDHTRWDVVYLYTIKHEDSIYEVSITKPATECQDFDPYQDIHLTKITDKIIQERVFELLEGYGLVAIDFLDNMIQDYFYNNRG